ncbi:hypothetical protein K9M74_04415 [Candidatus Woesearchaeota archaeon]|nr:hypothetical protein [Candidatus Woesearchaeota archaeon]
MRRGQVSIEFILLLVTGFFFMFTLVAAMVYLSADKTTEQAYYQLDDLGRGIQQELLLASRMQDGYQRTFILPTKVATHNYTIVLGNTSTYNGFISLQFANQEIYYPTPVVNGTFIKGANMLRKVNDVLYLN